MTKRVQWIGHITTQADLFIGRARELTVDTTTNELRVHDGSTPGGHRVLNKVQNDALYQPFGNSDFESITVDTINEHTGNAGVTIDGVLIKDGLVDGIDVSVRDAFLTTVDADLAVAEAALAAHIANVANPHAVTKTQVGLSNVTNDAQLKIASNLFDLDNAATARTNLGLGALATLSAVGSAQITDGAIVNADVNAAAAIALSKLATQAASTLLGNFTAGVAVPTAKANQYGLDLGASGPKVALQVALFQDQKANGTQGGASVAAWTTRTLNTTVLNGITGCSLAGNVVTLSQAGTYLLCGTQAFYASGMRQCRILNSSDTVEIGRSPYTDVGVSGIADNMVCFGAVTTAGSKNFVLQGRVSTARVTDGLGQDTSWAGEDEVYAQLLIVRIA